MEIWKHYSWRNTAAPLHFLFQAREYVNRFVSEYPEGKSAALLMTNAVLARLPSLPAVPSLGARKIRIVHFDAPDGPKSRAARKRIVAGVCAHRASGLAEEVHLQGGSDEAVLEAFDWDGMAMDSIRSR